MPLTQDWTLSNGMRASFVMPDMLQFADGSFDIPNAAQADVYHLVYGADGPATSAMAQLENDRRRLRGLYALFAIVCVSPVLQLDEAERKEGELGPRDLAWTDLTAVYNFFRYGPLTFVSAATDQEQGSGAGATHAGDDLPPGAE